jgi:threonine synthase
VQHRCLRCGKEFAHSFVPLCECGGMVEVFYDLKGARLYDSASPYVRYFDLLPLEDPASVVTAQHRATPTVHAAALGRELGLSHLYLKDETGLPTRTTKDRMAVVALSLFRELGVREFATSSTGNSSTAFAHYIGLYPGCRMYIFMGEDFMDRLNAAPSEQVVVFGLRGGTFVEAFAEAVAFAERRGIVSERGFFNPGRRAGLKTAYLEAAEALGRPIDWYVQAVSSAMGVYGAYQGAKELLAMGRTSSLPRLLCVQQETCCPMVRAFEAGSPVIRERDVVREPRGIASAILRGDPRRVYPYVRGIVLESGGTFVAVSEQEIRQARRMVEELEGISPCFNASTAVAGLARLARNGRIAAESTVVVNLTGADRPPGPDQPHVHWLKRTASGWAPADPRDREALELWEETRCPVRLPRG